MRRIIISNAFFQEVNEKKTQRKYLKNMLQVLWFSCCKNKMLVLFLNGDTKCIPCKYMYCYQRLSGIYLSRNSGDHVHPIYVNTAYRSASFKYCNYTANINSRPMFWLLSYLHCSIACRLHKHFKFSKVFFLRKAIMIYDHINAT